MALFRCYFCTNDFGAEGRDFEADKPICPECGADGNHPRMKSKVVSVEMVHFNPPSKFKGVGVPYLACTPDVPFPDPKAKGPVQATGEPSCVTCPACKGTALFTDAAEVTGIRVVVPEADFVIQSATEAANEMNAKEAKAPAPATQYESAPRPLTRPKE